MIRTTIISDFDPMDTANILTYVNMHCRMFRGYEQSPQVELEHVFDNTRGMVTVNYSKDQEKNVVTVSFMRHTPLKGAKPILKVVRNGKN